MCCDKKLYEGEASARRAAKRMAKGFGGKKQRPYWCNECKGFHLSSQPKKRNNGQNSRR